MTAYLLDTNHLGEAIRGSAILERLHLARRSGHRIGTCAPVLCELAAGVVQTPRFDDNWRALDAFLREVRVWPLSVETAAIYGKLYKELRAKGRILSQVDMMVASLARQLKLTVLTTDRDFEALPDIRTENWIAS